MGSKRLSGLMAVMGLCLAGTMALAADAPGNWPTWLGPTRDNKVTETGLLKEWPAGGPKLLWKTDILGKGFSSVSVANGIVYTTGDVDGKLMIFAFDGDGKLLWKVEHGAGFTDAGRFPGARATPTIDGENMYLFSAVGLLACYDAKTGAKKWEHNASEFGGRAPHWAYAESVLISGNMAIFTPGGTNCIVALDKATGKTIWQSTGFDGAAQYGSCIAITYENTPLIIAGTHKGLVCVDARDGKTLWSNPFSAGNTANCPTPAYADGYVVWANGYRKGAICMKLKNEGGKIGADVAWSNTDLVCHHGGYVIDNGLVYGNHNNGWTCLDLKTGAKKWFEQGVGKGSILWAGGTAYLFGEREGKAGLASMSPEGMQMKGTFSVAGKDASWAHPVVAGGRLYLRYETNLYCYDVKAK